jgi:hypothetical protein
LAGSVAEAGVLEDVAGVVGATVDGEAGAGSPQAASETTNSKQRSMEVTFFVINIPPTN